MCVSVTDRFVVCMRWAVKLNAGRNVTGVLRGYDQFMNLVLDHTQGKSADAYAMSHLPSRADWSAYYMFISGPAYALLSDGWNCTEHVPGSKTEKNEIGMVVVRGNSISMIECVDKVFG